MDIKDKIIAASSELFQRYGVRSVSMDDIAHHLAISKKTLYQNFKDKDDIVTTAFRRHMDKEKAEYVDIHARAKDPIDEMKRVSSCMRKDFKNINPSLLFDIQKYHPKAWEIWLAFKNDHIYGTITDNLKSGVEMGFFREDINVEILAKLRLETVQMAFDTRLFPPDKFDLSDIQVQIFEHFLQGVLTDKGRALYEKYTREEEVNQS